ncbi:TPA: hypothetical protein NDT34_004210 [Citrobacter freundii]|uniref:Uncharacterized protein n=1 Tax=Citrobacter freundii TaxID=546 RepID=A0AAP9QD69_CITFR|nr:hypothetical protein [Citrobacter freundii]EKV4142319.1 hypothetical protein [Citrobacter freundii]QLV31055.1 hypothetical protein HV178_14195 [Citrobacter freundii]QLW84404.1 hypothetical protein HV151_13635 [Citrobacter freundii]HBB6753519.1 hypothetical protein [Citrobacter freundii]HCD1460192.1 hypothetical protein [Citrobacter freundii]
MQCFIAHSVINGIDSTDNQKLAVQKGLAKAFQLAQSKKGSILVVVPNIQNIRHGVLSDALGDDFAALLAKPDTFSFQGVNVSRVPSNKVPTYISENTVVWMVHLQLVAAEAVTKACFGSTNIVATEWLPFDELNRWRTSNKAMVI